PKIEAIAHKFMHPADYANLALYPLQGYTPPQQLAFMWSAKESLFKWYSLGQVDFKEHLQLAGPVMPQPGNSVAMPFEIKKQPFIKLPVTGVFFQNIQLMLAWVAT
ncbi:MAG TPA: 4'-phosphopantetheinyl transferase superfamily protein, partial [Chitinophagaceae bacterium]|nr:4'-phosphopantetheinyl transferase superfamily protein [Chitinophagaceae bacterium]